MYTYKCYFHPKDNSLQSCKGCKLPVCGGCFGPEGFCPECTQRRDSIHQLKQMRAARSMQRTATTGRLRLSHAVGSGTLVAGMPHAASPRAAQNTVVRSGQDAYVRSGQPAARHGQPSSAPAIHPAAPQRPARTPSRPLQPIRDQFTEQSRPAAARAPQAAPAQQPVPQPRRYNPDNVAYKPVVPAMSATKAAPTSSGWAKPFFVGLTVGAAVVVAGYFGLQHHAETANHSLTAHPAAGTSLLNRFEAANDQAPRL